MPGQVRFNETMRGALSPGDDPTQAWMVGRSAGDDSMFSLVVITPDVDALLADPLHRSPVFGFVTLPLLHPLPMRVEEGNLDLFVEVGPTAVEMRYGMRLHAVDGRRYWLSGVKDVRKHRWWPTASTDTRKLFVSIRDDGPDGPIRLRGILWESWPEVLAQGVSFRGHLGAIARYLWFYTKVVLRISLSR